MDTKAYTAVRSQYLRDLIRHTKWDARKGRKYIDDLISLEGYLLHPPRGFSGGMHYSQLMTKYRGDWETLCKELNHKVLKEQLMWEEERKTTMEEFTEQLKEEEKQKRKDWIEAGGKV